MYEIIFLFLLGLIWIVFATIQDVRTREVSDWLNYSLIIFALGFRFFYSLFNGDFNFFYMGLFGFGIFFLLGNLFYYSRIFAGGDAKLMMALGAILPLSSSFLVNLNMFFYFVMVFLLCGSAYGLVISLFLGIKHRKKVSREYGKQFRKFRKGVYGGLILAIVFISLSFVFYEVGNFLSTLLLVLSGVVFLLPYLYLYAKSIDECALVKKVKPSSLTLGDWLYKDIRVGKNLIKANWEGLNEKEINLLRKRGKEIYIKQGIPFVPVFLISYIVYFVVFVFGLIVF